VRLKAIAQLAVLIVLVPQAFAACTASKHDNRDSWVSWFRDGCPNITGACNPSLTSISLSNSNTNPNLLAVTAGDLVIINAWQNPSGTVTSITASNGQSTTNGQIVQVGATITTASMGQNRFFYFVSKSTGNMDITFTRGGIVGDGMEHQVSAMSFTPSAACTWSHHLDSAVATGSNWTANAPSITAPGDLIWNMTLVQGHSGTWNSPWLSSQWLPDFFLGLTNTSNAVAYILPQNNTGTQTNNITADTGTDPGWAAAMTSFTLGPQLNPPSNLSTLVR
jgi:hypothetical protein